MVGSWSLVEMIEVSLDGGEITYPMGIKPKGLIIYNRDGFMSAQIMSADSENFDTKNNAAYLAYSGPFQTDDEKETVSHTMYFSFLKIGETRHKSEKFLFKDGLLHLETEQPFMYNSRLVTHKLTWKRIEQSIKTINH